MKKDNKIITIDLAEKCNCIECRKIKLLKLHKKSSDIINKTYKEIKKFRNMLDNIITINKSAVKGSK